MLFVSIEAGHTAPMTSAKQNEPYPNAIRAIRLSKGLSQQALADLIGTSQSQIDRLERGSRRLTVDWLGKLSAALQVRGSDLFAMDEAFPLPTLRKLHGSVSFTTKIPEVGESTVPLYPTIPHPTRSEMFILPDVVIGSVRRPVGISDDVDAIAFHNSTSGMAPRFEIGELVFAARDLSPMSQGLGLLMFGPTSEFGERAALFCKSTIGPAPEDATVDEPNSKIFAFFHAIRTDWNDPTKHVFPIDTVAARYLVYDWPQLLSV